MPAQTEPNSGLKYGWTPGESGWAPDMDGNLLAIGRVLGQLAVISRAVTDPATLTPADGDRYIVAAGAVGAWTGQDANVAVWDAASGTWAFYAPSEGWLAYIQDEAVLSVYKAATGWSTGVAI